MDFVQHRAHDGALEQELDHGKLHGLFVTGNQRYVLQVGQELEDVLTERDALKAVNKELAKRGTAPGSTCARCHQVKQLL